MVQAADQQASCCVQVTQSLAVHCSMRENGGCLKHRSGLQISTRVGTAPQHTCSGRPPRQMLYQQAECEHITGGSASPWAAYPSSPAEQVQDVLHQLLEQPHQLKAL